MRENVTRPSVAIVGTGPAGLMAADVLSHHGYAVTLFEKKRWPAKKLLIAGSSGLNITNVLPLDEFMRQYTGPAALWHSVLGGYQPADWIVFIEKDLGIKTFKGTSGRYFVEGLKGARLVRAWLRRLQLQGVVLRHHAECVDFQRTDASGIVLRFADGSEFECQAAAFALGGGSYEPDETPLRWPSLFVRKGSGFSPFVPSNTGYRIAWRPEFLAEVEGQPLKNIILQSSRGRRKGDTVITAYGIEGTPVYFVGEPGVLSLDLKPDLTEDQIMERCLTLKENLSPLRRVKKKLNLCPVALALLYHHLPESVQEDLPALVRAIKSFPLEFIGPQPLSESISSAGGIHLDEINGDFMFKKIPGVFAAGEMLDWDAPTGGFLIQGCVSQGYTMAQGIIRYLDSRQGA